MRLGSISEDGHWWFLRRGHGTRSSSRTDIHVSLWCYMLLNNLYAPVEPHLITSSTWITKPEAKLLSLCNPTIRSTSILIAPEQNHNRVLRCSHPHTTVAVQPLVFKAGITTTDNSKSPDDQYLHARHYYFAPHLNFLGHVSQLLTGHLPSETIMGTRRYGDRCVRAGTDAILSFSLSFWNVFLYCNSTLLSVGPVKHVKSAIW